MVRKVPKAVALTNLTLTYRWRAMRASEICIGNDTFRPKEKIRATIASMDVLAAAKELQVEDDVQG